MVVYPRVVKVVKVERSVLDTIITEFGAWGGSLSGTPTEDAKEEEPKLPSKEMLAAQCLQFYLEPYRNVLVQDGEYPKKFKVDTVVTEIQHIYSLLHEPWVNNRKWTITPLMAMVSTTLSNR